MATPPTPAPGWPASIITLDPGTPNAQQLEHVSQGACQGPGCPQTPPPAACTDPDNCSLTAAYTYPVADATPGTHTLQVVSTDNLGHVSAPQTVTFVVDTIAPHLALSGPLSNADQQTITQNADLTADASADTGEGPGIQKIEVSVDGTVVGSTQQGLGQCQGTACDLSLDWTFDLSASYATDGPHSIDIVTTSFGGLTADEHELITVSHLASLPPQGLDIAASQPNLGDQPNQRIDGAGQGDRAGQSVTPIGDINGDGLDDYLIGAPKAGLDTTGKALAGAAYVVYGNSAGLPANLAAMTPEQGFRIDGQLPGDYAGVAVAALGDVNGDGTPDFAVGAPGTDGTLPAVKGGKVYVIFGSKCSTATAPDGSCQSATTNANLDLGNLGARGYVINGPALPAVQQNPLSPPAHFGAVIATHRSGSSSTSADVNNDGRDDIVIGSPDEAPNNLADAGSAYVVYGKADSSAQSIDGGAYGGYRIDGSSAGAALGSSVSIVGDTGGEEHADVAVGAPGDNSSNPATAATRTNAGTVYIVRGAAMPSAVSSGALLSATQSTGYAIYGASGDAIGRSVADIGDANGDGLADIGIGVAIPTSSTATSRPTTRARPTLRTSPIPTPPTATPSPRPPAQRASRPRSLASVISTTTPSLTSLSATRPPRPTDARPTARSTPSSARLAWTRRPGSISTSSAASRAPPSTESKARRPGPRSPQSTPPPTATPA